MTDTPPDRLCNTPGSPFFHEDALRRVMKDLLEREGFTVFEAGDGVKALDEIDRAGPDIVVLDLNLPRLDGYGVLSHLRSRPATANLPVIVLSNERREHAIIKLMQLGIADYILKPIEYVDVLLEKARKANRKVSLTIYGQVSKALLYFDGLDGLAIMPTVMVGAALGIFAYVAGNAVYSKYLLLKILLPPSFMLAPAEGTR